MRSLCLARVDSFRLPRILTDRDATVMLVRDRVRRTLIGKAPNRVSLRLAGDGAG